LLITDNPHFFNAGARCTKIGKKSLNKLNRQVWSRYPEASWPKIRGNNGVWP